MVEKRYITEKYLRCTCEKKQEVRVGMKYHKYLNILLVPLYLFFIAFFSLGIFTAWYYVAIVVGMLMFAMFIPRSYYMDAKKDMLKAGHSEECSKQIARLVVLHAGMWSNFKILNEEKVK